MVVQVNDVGMVGKVKIELTPYNAATIFSFLREFIEEDADVPYKLVALKSAIDEYCNEFFENITEEQFEDYKKENEINQIIGKSPLGRDKLK